MGDPEDRPDLTRRDLETIRLAAEMGYYESPRRCRMEDTAERLDVSKSAVYHRMSKAEREAITWFLEELGIEEELPRDADDASEMVDAIEGLLEGSERSEPPDDRSSETQEHR